MIHDHQFLLLCVPDTGDHSCMNYLVLSASILLLLLCFYYQPDTFRAKIQDLNHEIADMTKEIELYTQENSAFLSFEKR